MALVLKDRVKETTTTTGTGSFSLAGAVTGYDSFGQIGSGNTTYYACYLDGGSEWEVGIGTYTSPSTLSRDTILASSNSGNIVTFSAGQKTIWCDYPAGKSVYTDASGNVSRSIVDISAISGAIKTPESIEFDTNPSTIPTATGSMYWDNGNKTPSLVLDADVTLQVGQENVVLVYNNSASTITNGSVVAVNGAQGQRPAVVLADADSEALSASTLGIATEDIAAGAEGFVTTFGVIRGLNTNSFTDGAPIYLSQTAGQFTATRPSAPAHTVFLGWVIKVNASSGEIFVHISNGWELDELHNVKITSPTGGNLLSYDQTAGYWKNINLTDGTAISVTEATDGTVTIANTGVTALSAGTGISVSGSTGSVTVTNSAPDQTVSLTGAGTTTITGTYPNFTITSNDQYTGTVTAVTGTAPIASSGGNTPAISIPKATGSVDGYLSSTDWNTFNNKQPAGTYVTSVGATSPVTSTGGTTPTIAMPAANGSTNGYLTSTDWTTFNSKGNGTVTSVGGTGTVNGITLTGTVTSSGNLTLGGTLSNVNLASQVTGTLPIANGGTGQTSASAAFNALSPITTTGDLILGNGTNSATRLAIGANTYVLTSNGTTASWQAPSGGASSTYTRTSFTATGGQTTFSVTYTVGYIEVFLNGVLLNASDYTASNGTSVVLSVAAVAGDIVETIAYNLTTIGTYPASGITGTVAVNQGGTGLTSGTSGGVLYYSASGTLASSAALASNALVVGGGAGVAPSTVTTGTGVVTALGVNTGSAGAFVVNGGALGTPTSGNLSNCTADGTNAVGYRNVPRSGTAKNTSYTLATTDVGEYIEVTTGGSITVPDATFATGDIVSIFNNTSGAITLTMSITTAYIGGTDADKATISLATRGVATILFISSTVCVVNGNVS